MTGNFYRLLGWLIPILCMIAGGYVVVTNQRVLIADQALRQQASDQLARVTAQRDALLRAPNDRRYAAVEQAGNEQELFLNDLRTKALADGATIESWNATVTVYGDTASGPVPVDPDLNGLTRIGSTLEVEGPYGSLRRFLTDLTSSDRLFTVSNVTWNRANGSTSLHMTLSRYVSPPKKTVAQNPPSTNGQSSDSPSTGGAAQQQVHS